MLTERQDEQEQIQQDRVSSYPWWSAPFGIVSWWDMEEFSARGFYQIGRLLEKVKFDHRLYGSAFSTHPQLDQRLTAEQVEGLQKFARQVRKRCSRLGLRVSIQWCREIIATAETLTNRQTAGELEMLDRTIRSEMGVEMFFFMTPSEAELYKQDKPLFGEDVFNNFPSASNDIAEAGKCLAVKRITACVFHLMRVLEIGLGVLGARFGVSVEYTNWNVALEQIEKKVRNMRSDPQWASLPDCKEQQEFYAQVASHFGILKDAWRNYTVHIRGKYTDDEAKQILETVRSFMRQLATRLHE